MNRDYQDSFSIHIPDHKSNPLISNENPLKIITFLIFLYSTLSFQSHHFIFLLIPHLILITNFLYYKTTQTFTNVHLFDSACSIIAIFLYLNDIPSQLLISFTFYTFEFSQHISKKCIQVLTKIRNLAVTILFLFSLFGYWFTFLYHRYTKMGQFFGHYGYTCLTLIQVMTLDAWGQIGRQMELAEKEQDFIYTSGFVGFLLIVYIFIITYFYMNILIGLMLETIQEDNQTQVKEASDQYNMSFIDDLILGAKYQSMVFIFSFGTMILNIYHHFQDYDQQSEIILSVIDDIIYSIHFLIINYKQGKWYSIERQSKSMMLIHFISGPISLVSLSFADHNVGSILNLLKLTTTPIIKGVFQGTVNIFPLLFPSLLLLINVTMICSAWSTYSYNQFIGLNQERYFSSFWESFYTFMQVMTLDDWGAAILPVFHNEYILPNILFFIYIVFSNFAILNIMVAIACEHFKEIDFGQTYISFLSVYQTQSNDPILYLKNTLHKIHDQIKFKHVRLNTYLDPVLSQKIRKEGVIQIQYKKRIIQHVLIIE